jgi:hypothetical protein
MTAIKVALAKLPCPYQEWKVEPGAFGPAPQRVPIMRRGGQGSIGAADVYEVDGVLFAELTFELRGVPAGMFPATLPSDPDEARARLGGTFKVQPLERDESHGVVTRAELLWIEAIPHDPSGAALGEIMDAAAKAEDRA